MGTSTQQQSHTAPAPTSLGRRDSAGSSGTHTFLTNTNNVTVRGRCSPVTSCGHVDSKKEGAKKVEDALTDFRRLASGDCSVAGGDEKKAATSDDATLEHVDVAASSGADRMEVEETCECDALSTATTQSYASSEDEGAAAVTPVSLAGGSSQLNNQMDRQPFSSMSSYPPLPMNTQPQPAWSNNDHTNTLPGDNLRALMAMASAMDVSNMSHSSAFPTLQPPSAAAPSASSVSSPSTKALQSMQRILNLNQSAANHFLASSNEGGVSSGEAIVMSSSDIEWALGDLHRAEWVRCHLVDELKLNASRSFDGYNVASRSAHKRSCCGSVKKQSSPRSAPSGLSSSFTSGTTITTSSMGRPQQMRRVDSSSTATSRQSLPHQQDSFAQMLSDSVNAMDKEDDVARTSYIYQRMDFDEGMHSFASLETIDPASFWITVNGNVANGHASVYYEPVYETSPVVEATLVFNVGQVHRRKGDLDAASKCYEQSLHILQQQQQLNNSHSMYHAQQEEHPPIMIPILHNIGQLQYRRGDIPLAMETYTRALTCAKNMYGEDHPHVASALNCLGVLHYHDANSSSGASQQSTSSTSPVVTSSVVVSAQDKGKEQQKQAESSDCIDADSSVDNDDENSNTEKQQQQHKSTQQAMSLFQDALSIRLATLGPAHVDIATVLNNIGRIHVQLDEFDRALGYYEDALRIRRDTLGPDSLDYAATAFNAGQSFHQKGELERAAELYHEFLRVALMKFGHGHRDVAVVLSGIAQIHQEKQEYEKARELYEASLCAGKAALGEDHSEIAMLLNRMGNFHFERERLEEALKCYKRGLRIERRVLPADHPNIVVTLSNLGEIHRQRNEWDEAAKMYGDCLDILRTKHEDEDHIDVASTLSTIGLIHDQRGDTCLSLHYLQDALIMRRRLLGNDHLDVSATLVYIGTILYRKSVFSVAIELFSESLRIRQAALGNGHRDVAFVLYNIALVHQQRGCYEEAIEAYGETLRIEKLVLGEKHRDVSMTLFKLGEVNKAAGDLEAALKCFEESLDVERNLSGTTAASTSENNDYDDSAAATSQDTMDTTSSASPRPQQQQQSPDHAAMARALNEIGNIQLARGEVVPMMEAFNEASRLYRSAGLSPHNVVVSGHLYALEFSCPEAAPAA